MSVCECVIKKTCENIEVPDGFVYIDDSFDIRKSSTTKSLDKIVFITNNKGLVMFWNMVKAKDCFTVRIFLTFCQLVDFQLWKKVYYFRLTSATY